MTAKTAADAERVAGAAPQEATGWHAIDWLKAHRVVRRLQARIVKATQEGRWGKVRALQHLLTHSFSGKALAVRRVTENHGKRTPGVDGVTWSTPAHKAQAVRALRQRGYRPQPLRRLYIPKRNGKLRPLSVATMHDRAMQALYLLALDPVAETTADPHSYGFRRERSPADALRRCHRLLAGPTKATWILEADIERCFERISHDWLVAHVPLDRAILRKWLRAGYLERHVLHPTDEGVPQGSPISPALANWALDGLDTLLRERFPKLPSATNGRVNLVRFADDFIITGKTKELLEDEVRPLVAAFLKERGLELSAEKTSITHIEDGFDFLGQTVRKFGNTCLTKPSKKSVKALLAKARGVIKANAQAPAGQLIVQLNTLIRGWALYHRHGASKQTFRSVDCAIFRALWRWACRRHPAKSRRWVRQKYFQTLGHRHWVFSGEIAGPAGRPKPVRLIAAALVPIERHVAIREDANPYDPAWEPYFERRLGVTMAATLKGRRTLLYLWKRQNGLCPHCRQPITRITGWENHHRVWLSLGGGDQAENRELLHPTCHRQVHSRAHRGEPRPVRGV